MRRLLILILSLALILSASAAGAAGTVIYGGSDDGGSFITNMVSSVVYIRGTTYVFTSDSRGFLAISDTGERTRFTWEEDTIVTYGEDTLVFQTAVGYEGTLYALLIRYTHDAEDDSTRVRGAYLYEVTLDDENQTAGLGERIKLDWSDMIDDYDDSEYTRNTSTPFIQDGKLVFITYGASGSYEVMIYDIETGDIEPMQIENLERVAAYVDGKVLVETCDYNSSPAKYAFLTLDLDSGELTQLFQKDMPDMLCPSDFVYDAKSDNLYYRMAGELWAAPGMDIDKARSIGVASGYGAYNSQPVITDDGYLIMPDAEFVMKYNADPDARSGRAIKVVDWGMTTEDAARAFNERRPDVDVIRSDDQEGVVEDMMNRSSDTDVYMLEMSSSDYMAVYNRSFMADLSSSALLTGIVGEMYEGISKSAIKDGVLVALPIHMYAPMLGYEVKAFEAVGLSQDDVPHTWIEFFELLKVLPDIVDDYSNVTLFDVMSPASDMRLSLLERMLTSYMLYLGSEPGAGTSFDSPLLRGILSAFDDIDFDRMGLPESGDSYEYAEIDEQSLFTTWGALNVSESIYTYMTDLLLLALSEDIPPLVQAEVTAMFVNPFSENIDLAIEFVECAAENLDKVFLVNVCPGRNEPVENPYADEILEDFQKSIADMESALEKADEDSAIVIQSNIKNLQKDLEAFERDGKYIATAESISKYRRHADSIRAGSSLGIDIKTSPEIATTIRQYADGAINADALIRNIDQRLRMMMLEGM